MAEIALTTDTLSVILTGFRKVFALKSRIDVPLAHVRHIAHDPSVDLPSPFFQVKMPGTYIPGVITAGTFHMSGERRFIDVRDRTKAVVIDLQNEQYDKLVLEVEDPIATVQQVRESLASFRSDDAFPE